MMSVGRKRMIKMPTMWGFPGIRCSGFLASLIIWQLGDVWIVASCYHCKVNISTDPFDYEVLIRGYWGLWGWRYHGFKLLNYHWRKTADSSLYSIPNGPNSRTLISSFFFISSIYCYRTTYTRTLLAKSLMPIGKFFRHTIHLSSRFKNIIGRVSKMVFLNLLQARPKISKWRIFEACKLSLSERWQSSQI